MTLKLCILRENLWLIFDPDAVLQVFLHVTRETIMIWAWHFTKLGKVTEKSKNKRKNWDSCLKCDPCHWLVSAKSAWLTLVFMLVQHLFSETQTYCVTHITRMYWGATKEANWIVLPAGESEMCVCTCIPMGVPLLSISRKLWDTEQQHNRY